MTPAEQCWKAVTQPGAILVAVERRLVDAGALIELRQLHGLSASEVDVLLWLETHEPGCSSGGPHDPDGEVAA